MTPDRQSRIEAALGESIADLQAISGGCIADSRQLTTHTGKLFFLKQVRPGQNPNMLRAEASGLHELRKAKAVRVPEVLAVEFDFLLLEFIPAGRAHSGSYAELGRNFAQLHRLRGKVFGFHEDNFLGTSLQSNRASGTAVSNWVTFYAEQRLGFQLRLAERTGAATPELRRGLGRLLDKLPDLLSGTEEPPTLLHGDLWSGNHLIDTQGRGWLIDPAVSYGHREADLAMTTLFGGYPSEFYAAYQEAHPLPSGWREREPLYHLYHLLNHLNLFGSGYLGQVLAVIRRYVG